MTVTSARITDRQTRFRLEKRKVIKAPVSVVYQAWTETEQMVKWFGCAQCNKVKIKQDFKIGGHYRVDMILDNAMILTVVGEFLEIIPNKRLVYTWSNNFPDFPARDTIVNVEFIDLGEGGTELILSHLNFDLEESRDSHSSGWDHALDKLVNAYKSTASGERVV